MPIYEYRCRECGNRFAYFHGAGQQQEALVCPSCAGEDLERIISAPFIPKKTNAFGDHCLCCEGQKKDQCLPGECCGKV